MNLATAAASVSLILVLAMLSFSTMELLNVLLAWFNVPPASPQINAHHAARPIISLWIMMAMIASALPAPFLS